MHQPNGFIVRYGARYVTADELASLSAFMTQRLTLDKVNAAVDDAAALAEGCARLLAAARSQGRLAPAERKRAQMKLVNVAVRPPCLCAGTACHWHGPQQACCPSGLAWRRPSTRLAGAT